MLSVQVTLFLWFQIGIIVVLQRVSLRCLCCALASLHKSFQAFTFRYANFYRNLRIIKETIPAIGLRLTNKLWNLLLSK